VVILTTRLQVHVIFHLFMIVESDVRGLVG
jgi:hypothetical protein